MNATLLVIALGSATLSSHGVDTRTIDSTFSPTKDLYRFANGKWLDTAKIPRDQPSVDSFYEVQTRTEAKVREIVDRILAKRDLKPGSVEEKIARFHKVYADDAKAEALGLSPIKALLEICEQANPGPEGLITAARLERYGVPVLLTSQVLNDFGDSRRRTLFLGQATLGLPDKDYYLKEDPSTKLVRNLYEQHMERLFGLAVPNAAQAKQEAARAFSFETKLAQISLGALQLRDVRAQYNPVEFVDYAKNHPKLAWTEFTRTEGFVNPGKVSIASPTYFDKLEKVLAETPKDELRSYLRWNVLNTYAGLLTKAFRDEQFTFQAAISGQVEATPDWRRYLEGTESVFGQAISKIYVAEMFSESAKARARNLILNLRSAFANRIRTNTWMSDSTKREALQKLMAITIKVGYPDKWESYDGLEVGDDSRVANIFRAVAFAHMKTVREFHKPVDRSRWGMTPITVNAYYNPMNNEIVFPAAILQPPFFDPEADDASNYGGIGMVMGHEMTHGFDDQGRLFDAKGNLRDWWTKEDRRKFDELKELLVKQYDKFMVQGSTHVNGALTVGENIADLGGVLIAHDALEQVLKAKKPSSIDGFSPDQRFFLSFAQIWRFKASPQYIDLLAKIDSHSPSSLRPAGALVNVPEFKAAFGVKAPNNSKPIRIW